MKVNSQINKTIQWISFLSWELFQTVLALFSGIGIAILYKLYTISKSQNGWVVDASITKGAFSLGPVIFGPKGLKADWTDHLFVHESGHSIQSQYLGPLYIFVIGIPSVLSAWLIPEAHNQRWYEVWANRLAIKKAKKHFIGFDTAAYIEEGRCSHYQNSRNGGYNYFGNPIDYRFAFVDLLLILPSLLLIQLMIYFIYIIGF